MFPKRDHSSRCTSVLKSWLECCNTFEWLISWQFLLFDSPSFSLTPRNITKVQTTNTPPITPAAIMYTSFCKEKERWETISFHFTQPAQSSLFLAFSPSLIHRCFKRLKNWSSSFQHARRPLWNQTARGRLSFYPTPGCFFLSAFFCSFHFNPHSSIIDCLWIFVLFSTSAQRRAMPCTHLQIQA